jgi:hypothetical protein
MMVGMCVLFASILTNPYSALNPFPPFTKIPPTITATWTPIKLSPTWTYTPTVPPTETNTPRPTYTLEPSLTPFIIPSATSLFTPTYTATASRTPKPTGVPYGVTITPSESTTYRADTSCATMYVAGQALDNKKNPVLGLQVRLGGSVPGKTFNPPLTTLTGIFTVYGPSGFEFDLGIQPVDSKSSLWIQLFDQSSAPLSDQVFLTTYSDCKKNLIYVRFTQK